MERIKSILESLCQIVTISGNEYRAEERLRELCKGIFDSVERTPLGTFVLVKRAKKPNAKKILIDAHFDTVGMMVREIEENGFLKVVPIGGLDPRVLPATEVTVYGKEDIYGLITSTPPHLVKAGDQEILPLKDLAIDTGYKTEELEKLVSVGDVVGYRYKLTEMHGGYIATTGLDDKSCLAGIIYAVESIDEDKLEYDIYVTASSQEETGRSGAPAVSAMIKPDIAIITDVNFASGDGTPDYECIKCKEGASVDISSLTDRRLTRAVIKLLKDKNIKHQLICESGRTHTNNEAILVSGTGVRTVLLSIPLKNMHTPSEIVNLEDIKAFSQILSAIVYEENL